jgi:tetratricopeptide (TPR) repeat protein
LEPNEGIAYFYSMEHWAWYYNEGIASKEAKDFELSATHHLKVLEMEPDLEMPEAWHNAGAALLRLGKSAEAEPYLRKAIALYDMLIEAIIEVDGMEMEDEATGFLFDDDEDFGDDDDDDDEEWNELSAAAYSDEEPDFELGDDELYGDESVAYYLFWKACCFSLLREKEPMLRTLANCVAEDDWYAVEATSEEDMSYFSDDPDFRRLIDPVMERINSPNHRHLFEIFERIEKKVLTGFEDPDEFIEDLIDEVDSENWTDETPVTWMRKTVRDLYIRHEERSATWSHPTDVERLAEVFNRLCRDGILALHKTGFTQTEAIEEVTEVMNDMVLSPDQIKGFCFYSGENVEELIYQESGSLHITFNSILLDDPQFGITIGNIIAGRLREQGFLFNWDGTMRSRIEILQFSWKKIFISDGDQQQWDHWRVFDLF